MNGHFSRDTQVVRKHMKSSTSWGVKEMQITTTSRSHYTPSRKATVKNLWNSKCWGAVEKPNACPLLVGRHSDSAAAESRRAVPQKLKHRNNMEPSNFGPRWIPQGTGDSTPTQWAEARWQQPPPQRPQVDTTLASISRGMDARVGYVHTIKHYSATTGREFWHMLERGWTRKTSC